jgi:flagellar hook-basal body complex protein FliE
VDVLHGIASQNQRIAVLKRWLSKPPIKADCLRLMTTGDSPITLHEWPKDSLRPDLAHEIEQLVEEHVREMSDAPRDVCFALVFVSEDGDRALSTKPYRYRRPVEVGGTSAEDVARDLIDDSPNGVMLAIVKQSLLHNEANTRLYMQGQSSLVFALVQVLDKIADRLIQSEERTDHAREKHAELLMKVVDEMGEAGEGEQPKELTPAQERFMALAEKALPLLLMRLAANNNGPSAAAAAAAG